jgi:hypothetical protein
MKRYTTTPAQQPKSTASNSSELRQELDAVTKHITQAIIKDPKKAATIFEGWLAPAASGQKKKRAA